MTRYVELDFETGSAADLKLCGAWAYAEHPTTEILCLVYRDGEEGEHLWYPGEPPVPLRNYAADPNVIFVAHNAGFEQAIWASIMVPVFGLPPLPPERWEDTMATAAWKAIPLSLDKCGRALGLPVEKDMEGSRLTLSMSRPNKTGMLPERTPEVMERIADYCAKDVEVEGQVRGRLGLLSEQSPQERKIWLYDQAINQRGVRIDLAFVRAAELVCERATGPLLAEFRDLTGGLNPGQRDKLIAWCGKEGVELESLRKEYLAELLDDNDDGDDAGYVSNAFEDDAGVSAPGRAISSGTVRRVLQIRSMLGSASIKKLPRMRACVSEDGRARGLVQYHAASTGRWGGRLFQPHNFPRGVLKVDPELAVDAIMSGDPEFVEAVLGHPAIECVASSLRHALVPDEGKIFCAGDFAGIEARVALALAGQHDKTALMASGVDVYCHMAETIYRRPVTKENDPELRQLGKCAVLGCGFQCGPENFNTKFLGGKDLAAAELAVSTYRNAWAPKVPQLWYALDAAALAAVRTGRGDAYGVEYKQEGDWLVAGLPSGWQRLWYRTPRLDRDDRFDRPCWTYRAYKGGRMSQAKAYGGLLTENAVQGLARGLLCASVDRLERADYPVVLTVHDEIICEIDEDKADLKRFEELMAEPTLWARRLKIPIAVEAWQGKRYRK